MRVEVVIDVAAPGSRHPACAVSVLLDSDKTQCAIMALLHSVSLLLLLLLHCHLTPPQHAQPPAACSVLTTPTNCCRVATTWCSAATACSTSLCTVGGDQGSGGETRHGVGWGGGGHYSPLRWQRRLSSWHHQCSGRLKPTFPPLVSIKLECELCCSMAMSLCPSVCSLSQVPGSF